MVRSILPGREIPLVWRMVWQEDCQPCSAKPDIEAKAKKNVRLIISKTTSTGETQYLRRQRDSRTPIRRESRTLGSQGAGSQRAASPIVGLLGFGSQGAGSRASESQGSGQPGHGRDKEQDQAGRDADDRDGAGSDRDSSPRDEIATAIERIKQMDAETLANLARAFLRPAEAKG